MSYCKLTARQVDQLREVYRSPFRHRRPEILVIQKGTVSRAVELEQTEDGSVAVLIANTHIVLVCGLEKDVGALYTSICLVNTSEDRKRKDEEKDRV